MVEGMAGVPSRAEIIVVNPALDLRGIDAAWSASRRRVEVSLRVRDSLTAVLDGSTAALDFVNQYASRRAAHRGGYAAQALLEALIRSLQPAADAPRDTERRNELVAATMAVHLTRFIRALGLDELEPRILELPQITEVRAKAARTLRKVEAEARSSGERTGSVLVRELTGRRYTVAEAVRIRH